MVLLHSFEDTVSKINLLYSKKSEKQTFVKYFVRDLIKQAKIKGIEFYKDQEELLFNDYYAFFKKFFNDDEYYEKHLRKVYTDKQKYYDYLLEKIYYDFVRNVQDKDNSLYFSFNKDKFLMAV